MEALSISVGDVAQSMTLSVRIRGQRRFAARLWIARRLLALTAFIVGTKLAIDAELT